MGDFLKGFIGGGVGIFAYILIHGNPAVPARLIGECNGQLLAAMEEDQFPSSCDWIEPILYHPAGKVK